MRALAIAIILLPALSFAQELVTDGMRVMRAEVSEVLSQETQLIPGTDVPTTYQTIKARILTGEDAGETVTIENDFLVLERGDVFYMRLTIDALDDTTSYSVLEPYRLPQLGLLAALFVSVVAVFGGMQGMRGLISLIGSVLIIVYVLLPSMIAGYPPVAVSMAAASFIVIFGSYVTHGVSRMTTTAVLGMIGTIGFTGLLAYLAIDWTKMSGFAAEEATYLLLNTRGTIDLTGLYLGGILIGLLGVLYDAAIGQSVAVEELKRADPSAENSHIVRRALRMGREHIGALVNTLAIAYVGASLPLLLFFYSGSHDLLEVVNREIFAAEILRILLSSIGVVLVVPLTTVIAAWLISSPPEAASYKGHTH